MDEKILQVLQEIKKELQDIRSILEQKEIKIKINDDLVFKKLNDEMRKQIRT